MGGPMAQRCGGPVGVSVGEQQGCVCWAMHDRLCTWPNLEIARAAAILFDFSEKSCPSQAGQMGNVAGADSACIYARFGYGGMIPDL